MFTSNLIKPLWVSTVRCGNKELTDKQKEFNDWLKTVSTKHIEYIADEVKTTIDGYRRFTTITTVPIGMTTGIAQPSFPIGVRQSDSQEGDE